MPIIVDQLDPRFVNCDLAVEARKLGIPPGSIGPRAFAAPRPRYEDVVELIPEDQWKPLSDAANEADQTMAQLVNWIFNQRNEGSCVGNACTQGVQVLFAKEFGKDLAIQLSAISCYKQIGSSPNSGANVEDGLNALENVGVLPLDTPENRARFQHVMPPTGFYTPWPEGWKETAKNFRVVEAYSVQSVAGLATALLRGHPVVVGRAGHSILYLAVIFKDGTMNCLYVNSWGEWGFAAGAMTYGFGLDSMSYVRSSAQWAAALRTVVVPSFMIAA